MTATIIGVPRATPRIDLGVGDSRDAQGLGQWQPDAGGPADSRWQPDDATAAAEARWNGEEPFWVDVTCYGLEVDTYTGRDRATDQWEVGTATIVLDNSTGWADYPPTVEPNPFDLTVRPGRPVRVSVQLDADTSAKGPFILWRGWVDQANPGFDAEQGDIVTLECIDAKGELGRVQVAAVDPPVGAGETIQARLNRICNAAAWPAYWRNFEGTAITVVATELDGQAADLLNLTADSGGGSLFGDIDGKLRYRNRDWQLWPADELDDGAIGNGAGASFDETDLTEDPAGSDLYDPAPITLSEDPAGSGLYDPSEPAFEEPAGSGLFILGAPITGDWCPTAWDLMFAREDITTRVVIGRTDMATPIVLNDEDAQKLYGIETLDVTDLETTLNVELTEIGNRLLVTRGHDFMPRIAAVTVNAATDLRIVNLLASADPRIPSRFRCRHDSGGRQVFSRLMFCTAISHTIGPDLWEARLSLDDASPWQVGADSGFWNEAEIPGAGHWQQSKWQGAIRP